MILTQPTIDTGCPDCRGAGFFRAPGAGHTVALVNCPRCNPAPIDELAAAENTRRMEGSSRKRDGRGRWWSDS